jgi:hypothetical protein
MTMAVNNESIKKLLIISGFFIENFDGIAVSSKDKVRVDVTALYSKSI